MEVTAEGAVRWALPTVGRDRFTCAMKLITTRYMLLMGLAFVVGLAGAVWGLRESMVPLTAETLARARGLWASADIRDYDASYRMNGSLCAVKVRGGIVMEVDVDERQSRSAEWGSYSMVGLFDLLQLELENFSDPNGPFAGGKETIVARVRFNEQYGYVERYLRAGGGLPQGATIDRIEFEVVGRLE